MTKFEKIFMLALFASIYSLDRSNDRLIKRNQQLDMRLQSAQQYHQQLLIEPHELRRQNQEVEK